MSLDEHSLEKLMTTKLQTLLPYAEKVVIDFSSKCSHIDILSKIRKLCDYDVAESPNSLAIM